jgi:isopentenyl-diphosphate delta-isomerase
MSVEQLILVDEHDNVVGFDEKLAVHQNGGRLHRAFSIFIYNSAGEMLLQRRAQTKYHFGGLWTNACCSHPRRGERLQEAVHQRLQFELGFDTELDEVLSFIYKSEDPNSGLVEHEYDHVFVGTFDGDAVPNAAEVDAVKWIAVPELKADLNRNPSQYTPWFRIAMDKLDNNR